MTKFYVDSKGKYLGGFDGANPPQGSTQVSSPPPHGLFTWNGSAWVEPSDFYVLKRAQEYEKRGVTVKALLEALIEAFVELRPEKLDALQAIREQVKSEIPKP